MANTTADKLARLQQTKEDLQAALAEQGQPVDAVFSAYPAAVRAIRKTREDAPYNDVNFYDVDGVRLFSCSLEEVWGLPDLPVPPERPGLRFQEWNWTLEEVQDLKTPADIGAHYITDDGKTRLHLNIPGGATNRQQADCGDITLCFQQSAANGIVIDWGDGSAAESAAGTGKVTMSHRFADAGRYTVTLEPVGDCILELGHSSSRYCLMGPEGDEQDLQRSTLTAVEIGRNVQKVSTYGLSNCPALEMVSIPAEVTALEQAALIASTALRQLSVPRGVERLEGGSINQIWGLRHLSLPPTIREIAPACFNNLDLLTDSLSLPPAVQTIGNLNFTNCHMPSVRIPASVETMGNGVFQNCKNLRAVYMMPPTPPTLGDETAFANIPADCTFYVASGSLPDYERAPFWSELASRHTMVDYEEP